MFTVPTARLVVKKLVVVPFTNVAEVADRTPTDAELEYKFVEVEFVAKELVVVELVKRELTASRLVM